MKKNTFRNGFICGIIAVNLAHLLGELADPLLDKLAEKVNTQRKRAIATAATMRATWIALECRKRAIIHQTPEQAREAFIVWHCNMDDENQRIIACPIHKDEIMRLQKISLNNWPMSRDAMAGTIDGGNTKVYVDDTGSVYDEFHHYIGEVDQDVQGLVLDDGS